MAISFIQGQYEYTRLSGYSSLWGKWGWYDVKAGSNEFSTFKQSEGSWEWVSGDSLCFTVNYTSGSNLGTVILDAFYGESRTLKDNFVSITYNGANSFTVKALKACSEIWVSISGTVRSRVAVSAKVADGYKNLRTFDDMPDVVTDSGNTYSIVSLNMCFYDCWEITNPPRLSSNAIDMERCFQNCRELSVPPVIPNGVTTLRFCFSSCKSLTQAPVIPSSVTDIRSCFTSCSSLEQAPAIPNSVTILNSCFSSCDSLTQAPIIPSSVTDMDYCFHGCTSLTGNVVVYNSPTSSKDVFGSTSENIFIINKGSGETEWKSIASQFQNVHYEEEDNLPPSISNFTATRVSAIGETTYEPTGLYAYVQARMMVHKIIPDGWTNEIKNIFLTNNGDSESPTWQPEVTEFPVDRYCWIYLGDTASHNLTLQISDSIKVDGTEIKSQDSVVLSIPILKTYVLVDYFHDPNATGDTEGIAFGKYADTAALFDVAMPARFNDYVQYRGGQFILRGIFVDTQEPTSTDGEDGDIWLVYEE